MARTALPPKKNVALMLLEAGHIFVHLDPRHPDVVVPKWLSKQPQLILRLDEADSVGAVKVDDTGVQARLEFKQAPFDCAIPWCSIYALIGEHGRGMVWPDDVPFEVSPPEKLRSPNAAPKRSRPKLTGYQSRRSAPSAGFDERPADDLPASVAPTSAAAEPPSPPAGSSPGDARPPGAGRGRRPLPPYLRVIK